MQHLTFSLVNLTPAAEGEAIIYNAGEPSLNQLQLTLTNNGPELKLKAGCPLPEDKLPPGQTGLYLSFGQILTDMGKGLEINAEGWGSTYTSAGNWALSPSSEMVLAKGEKVTLKLSGFKVNPNSTTGYLTVDYLGFSGIRDNSVQLHVTVAAPPTQGKKSLQNVLAMESLDGQNAVFLMASPQESFDNSLSFSLRNKNKMEPLKCGPNTIFTISAVFGKVPGYGALCSPDQSKLIKMTSVGSEANDWTIERDANGEIVTWHFKPLTQVLGIGEDASQQIDLEHLTSNLEPGNTSLYLSWTKVPGYNDGSISLLLEKKRQPEITSFSVTPDKVVINGPSDQKTVKLQWQVKNAPDLVLLEGEPVDDAGTKEVKAGVSKNEFTLNATFGRNHSVTKEIQVAVNFSSVKIDSFTSDHKFLNLRGENTVPVKVSWTVTNATSISFSGNLISGLQPATGERTIQLSMVDMASLPSHPLLYGMNLVITAEGDGQQSVEQTLTIYAGILPMRMRVLSEWMKAAQNWLIQYPKEPVFNALYVLGNEAQNGPLATLEDANSEAFGIIIPLWLKLKATDSSTPITNEDCANAAQALQRVSTMYTQGVSSVNIYFEKVTVFEALYLTDDKLRKLVELMGQNNAMQFAMYAGYPQSLSQNFIRDMPKIGASLKTLATNLDTLAAASSTERNAALQAAKTACMANLKTLNGYTFS